MYLLQTEDGKVFKVNKIQTGDLDASADGVLLIIDLKTLTIHNRPDDDDEWLPIKEYEF